MPARATISGVSVTTSPAAAGLEPDVVGFVPLGIGIPACSPGATDADSPLAAAHGLVSDGWSDGIRQSLAPRTTLTAITPTPIAVARARFIESPSAPFAARPARRTRARGRLCTLIPCRGSDVAPPAVRKAVCA